MSSKRVAASCNIHQMKTVQMWQEVQNNADHLDLSLVAILACPKIEGAC